MNQHRQLVMDLLTAPWVFPFASRLLPACPSARKLYFRALAPAFAYTTPSLGRPTTFDKARFFALIFQDLLPAFPDLSFNAAFVTTTGLDDLAHVTVAVTGTHTGAPFGASLGLPPLPAQGARVALPPEFWRLRIEDLTVLSLQADPPAPGMERLAFPGGIYAALGGQLPGF